MTAPRTVSFQSEAQKRDAAVKNVAEAAVVLIEDKLPEKIDRAVMASIQKNSAKDAYDRGKTDGLELGGARADKRFWHGVVSGALGGVGVTILAVWLLGFVLGGIAIQGITADRVFDRFETQQDDLNRQLDEKAQQ